MKGQTCASCAGEVTPARPAAPARRDAGPSLSSQPCPSATACGVHSRTDAS